MNYDLSLSSRQSACRRAHIYGAESMALAAEAARLQAAADAARRRYFRELEAIDLLGGHGPSPFAELGK